jgi:hypothetical protein
MQESGASRTARYLVPALLALYIAQCVWFIRTQSFTVDESDHIIAGLDAWRFGEFERWHEHPPLARLWFTLPLLGVDTKYENRAPYAGQQPIPGARVEEALQTDAKLGRGGEGWHVGEDAIPVSPRPEVWLYRTRPMNVALGVGLLLLLWVAVRGLFSEGSATFVLALAAVSPELVAHYSIATTDGAATLLLFAGVMQFVRWQRRPTGAQTLLMAAALGAMLIAKLNMFPMVLLTLLLALILKPNTAAPTPARLWERILWPPRLWNWGKTTAMAAVACFIVWAGYFFHVSRVVFDKGSVTLHFQGYTKLLTYPIPTSKHFQLFIPACEYLTGVGMLFVHNMLGHRSFFLGQISETGGWKLYFPVAVCLKWPLIVLGLALWGMLILLRQRAWPNGLLLMSVFPAVLFSMVIFGRINMGVRHVLPVYPFLLVYTAAAAEWLLKRRKWQWVLVLLVCLQAGDSLRYAPGYLSYFNAFVNPARSYELLSDSNLDWGQGLLALRAYQDKHPSETLHLAYFGLVDPAWYGIRYVAMKEGERASGTVVVSATHLSGQLLKNPASYHWLLAYPRKAILDHCLYVFEVPDTQ